MIISLTNPGSCLQLFGHNFPPPTREFHRNRGQRLCQMKKFMIFKNIASQFFAKLIPDDCVQETAAKKTFFGCETFRLQSPTQPHRTDSQKIFTFNIKNAIPKFKIFGVVSKRSEACPKAPHCVNVYSFGAKK